MFGYELKYNTSSVNNPNAPVSHSGRITEVIWKSISDASKKSYACKYDKASRMLAAYYSEYNSVASNWSTNVDKFSEYDIAYDPNGNMTTLKRKGYATNSTTQLIDNLSFNISDNKITTVVDAATIQGYNDFKPTSNSYVYDANGNITSDPSKNITITYNHLNLPLTITGTLGTLQFTYDADGNRLKKKWTPISGSIITNYYVNGVVYNSTVLEYFGTSEGRLVPDGTLGWQYRYEHNYKDHLGNTRVAYSDLNANGVLTANEVIQENHFYAFGLDMYGLGKTQIGPTNKLKFGDKEYVDESGANLYDFGARYYSPVIARFLNVDPLAENTPNQGTFNYALNSPFNFNDPTGMAAEDWIEKCWDDKNKKYVETARHKDNSKTDTYVFRGGALDNQQLAYNKETGESTWSGGNSTAGSSTSGSASPNSGGAQIPSIPNIPYSDSDYDDYTVASDGSPRDLKTAANAFINVANDGIGLINMAMNPRQSAVNTAVAVIGTINYVRNSSATQIAKDAWAGIRSPEAGARVLSTYFEMGLLKNVKLKSGLKLESSVSKVMGKSYSSVGEVSVTIKNTELLNQLNASSKGVWVKVYEAGILNGKKIETHFFRNNSTNQVFDVKIKYNYWHQKQFKKL